MKNEAAERLLTTVQDELDFIEERATYHGQIVISLGAWRDTVRPLLERGARDERAAERRATVERILDALYKSGAERWSDIERVVREAAR